MPTAIGISHVAANAVVSMSLPPEGIKITPFIYHENIYMAAIAIPSGFTNGSTYAIKEFTTAENNQEILWQPGQEFSEIILFSLLLWEGPARRGDTIQQYYLGKGDGEVGDLPDNEAASLQIEYAAEQPANTPSLREYRGETISLPQERLFGAAGHHRSFAPQDEMGWINLSIIEEGNKLFIEKSASIHVLAGWNGRLIVGLITKEQMAGGWINLNQQGSRNNNVNILAMIAPTQTEDNEYTFQLGDPEKDGKVVLRRV